VIAVLTAAASQGSSIRSAQSARASAGRMPARTPARPAAADAACTRVRAAFVNAMRCSSQCAGAGDGGAELARRLGSDDGGSGDDGVASGDVSGR
jgi:hypothetical protein